MASSADRPQHWQPGDPLTADDRALLAPLLGKARELGRTPVRREVKNSAAVKRRFRTWGNAVRAAGLPWVNYPEQRRRAERARRGDQAALNHRDDPHDSPRGNSVADRVLHSERDSTDHGGDAHREAPAE